MVCFGFSPRLIVYLSGKIAYFLYCFFFVEELYIFSDENGSPTRGTRGILLSLPQYPFFWSGLTLSVTFLGPFFLLTGFCLFLWEIDVFHRCRTFSDRSRSTGKGYCLLLYLRPFLIFRITKYLFYFWSAFPSLFKSQ